MEIKVGDRFRPLPDSKQHGPKYWKRDAEGVWVEQEMTKEERDFAALESTLLFTDPASPSVRTSAITHSDAETDPHVKGYVDGFAIFPSVPFFPQKSPEQIKLEVDWEVRSLAMHSQQVPVPKLAEKPQENILAKVALQRGD